jgi:CheY-like chemotaxis protein
METREPTAARIILADDHPLFRSAVRDTLEKHSGSLEVVAEAADGLEALQLCRSFRPDLVMMDVGMPTMGGLEAARAIKRELPCTCLPGAACRTKRTVRRQGEHPRARSSAASPVRPRPPGDVMTQSARLGRRKAQ